MEVRINNLEELLLCKSNMLEKQQYFLQYQDDSSLLRDQKTELGEVAESFQIIKALKKRFRPSLKVRSSYQKSFRKYII